MKKGIKYSLSALCVSALLLTSFVNPSEEHEVKAGVTNTPIQGPILDKVELSVKFPDTVNETNSPSNEPNDANTIHDMVDRPSAYYPQRSGWSGIAYSCVREEYENIIDYYWNGYDWQPIYGEPTVISFWEKVGDHSTDESHRSHAPSVVQREVVQKYGQELYDAVVKSGAKFTYDANSKVPDRWIGKENNPHGSTGRYVIYSKDTLYYGTPCAYNGEKQYFYNNLEFFVKTNFEIEYKEPEGKDGSSKGRAYWELERTNPNAPSEVAVHVAFEGDFDKHEAVRNIKHKARLGSKNVEQEGQIDFHINAEQVKGKTLEYEYTYEYTNKQIGWQCSGSGEDAECVWNSNPDWRAVRTYTITGAIDVDHQQGETESWGDLDNALGKKWVVGREDDWSEVLKRNVFHEEYKRDQSNNTPTRFDLKTQSTLPILQGAIEYSVEVPSDKHEQANYAPMKQSKSFGYYFPADVDDSLKSTYANNTNYSGYDYAFPLQQNIMNDKGLQNNKRTYTIDYTTDLFLISERTGYIAGSPYAAAVKQSVVNNSAMPSLQQYVDIGKNNVQSGFTAFSGQPFRENVLYTNPINLEKLQRYYLPIHADSILHPNTEYKNHVAYEDLGLSDAKLEFDQTFTFKFYLFGSAKDDAYIVEQPESRIDLSNVPKEQLNGVVMTTEMIQELVNEKAARTAPRIHGFRYTDLGFTDAVKAIFNRNGQAVEHLNE